MSFLLAEFTQHVVCEVIGQRELFDNFLGLFENLLLAEVVLARAMTFLLRAVIVVMPFLPLAGDGAITLRALEPANERKILISSLLHFSPILHHLLTLVEELFADE